MKDKTGKFNLYAGVLTVIVMTVILYLDNQYRFLLRISLITNIFLFIYILYYKFKHKQNSKKEILTSNELLINKTNLLLEQIGKDSSNFKF